MKTLWVLAGVGLFGLLVAQGCASHNDAAMIAGLQRIGNQNIQEEQMNDLTQAIRDSQPQFYP